MSAPSAFRQWLAGMDASASRPDDEDHDSDYKVFLSLEGSETEADFSDDGELDLGLEENELVAGLDAASREELGLEALGFAARGQAGAHLFSHVPAQTVMKYRVKARGDGKCLMRAVHAQKEDPQHVLPRLPNGTPKQRGPRERENSAVDFMREQVVLYYRNYPSAFQQALDLDPTLSFESEMKRMAGVTSLVVLQPGPFFSNRI